jgi:hypothetical protein
VTLVLRVRRENFDRLFKPLHKIAMVERNVPTGLPSTQRHNRRSESFRRGLGAWTTKP